jgi:YtcA family
MLTVTWAFGPPMDVKVPPDLSFRSRSGRRGICFLCSSHTGRFLVATLPRKSPHRPVIPRRSPSDRRGICFCSENMKDRRNRFLGTLGMTGRGTSVEFLCVFAPLLLSSCSRAPSFDILGSFFPAWLVCLAVAILLTFLARWVLLRLHIAVVLPILVYPSLTFLLAFALWLIFFR